MLSYVGGKEKILKINHTKLLDWEEPDAILIDLGIKYKFIVYHKAWRKNF